MTEPTEVVPGIRVCPVRTPTLPPATHTNVWIVGHDALTVFDAASPWDDERERLFDHLAALGTPVERLVLTHHHHDHIGGVEDLRDRLLAATGTRVPVLAHPATAERVPFVDQTLNDGDTLACGGVTLRVWHTPGHAPGHLVFHDEASGQMIAGDMVAGVGTIAIEPGDGHVATYLASLERMREFGPEALLPAHGPVLAEADSILAFYLAHRNMRTEQIRTALDTLGTGTALDIAPEVYKELDPAYYPLAAVQITSHLIFLAEAGLAVENDGSWTLRDER